VEPATQPPTRAREARPPARGDEAQHDAPTKISARDYLEESLYPDLQPALRALERCRPRDPFSFMARACVDRAFLEATPGLGRIVALYCSASTLYQIH
jgi:hypothetical protein